MSLDAKARGLAKRALALAAQNAGGPADTTTTRLVSGGQVVWESSYTFRVSAASYLIAGQPYVSQEQTVALDAADASNPRIDVIALNTLGVVVKIPGTAAAQPSEPDVDPSTQLKLTFVLVAAASAQPAGVSNAAVYLENTEWTASTGGSGFNPNSSSNPYAGSKCIEGTNVANGAYVQFDRGAVTSLDSYQVLAMFVRSKAAWNSGRVLRVQWYAEGVAKGNPVTVASGYWGFDSSITTGYQQVAVPMSSFVLPPGTLVDQLRIMDVGGSIGFYIDNIVLQTTGSSLSASSVSTTLSQEQADSRYLRRLSVVTRSGTSYTAALADMDYYVVFTSSSAVTLTIPPNSSVAFPVGTVLTHEQGGTGVVTLSPGSGVTLRSRGDLLASAGQYAVVQVKKVAADSWTVIGDVA